MTNIKPPRNMIRANLDEDVRFFIFYTGDEYGEEFESYSEWKSKAEEATQRGDGFEMWFQVMRYGKKINIEGEI